MTIQGEPKTFNKNGGTGQNLARTFCPNCGTTMFGEPDSFGAIRAVRAGVLDDDEGVEPALSVFTSRAFCWDSPPADIPAHEEALPRGSTHWFDRRYSS